MLLFTLPAAVHAELAIDGRLDEPDWAEAQVFEDFTVIQPLTYNTPRWKTEARLLSLPEGLAVAFVCEQPEETRTRTVTQRDTDRFDADAVSLTIAFDGKSEKLFQFSVSLSGSYRDGTLDYKNRLNRDWDGLWQRAVHETDEEWTVEMLLPWSIVAMQSAGDGARRMGVFFQRDIYATSESFGWPQTSLELQRFSSDIAKVEVQSYSNGEFHAWPYATILGDLVDESTDTKVGLDLFWKPGGNFQVAATFNPDFGQVESDDLVIDFSATEVQFSDKRPFFTENQSIFDDALVKNESVFYTRRIGGPRDDDGGVSDIDGAAKIIGSAGSLNYGLFAAHEADEGNVGRKYYAGRFVYPGTNWLVGTQTTYTDRPFLDRTALVNALNYDIKLGENLRMVGQFMASDVDAGQESTEGFGSFNAVQYNPNDRWDFEFSLLHYGDELDINDMGYLQRNDLVEWFFSFSHNKTDFSETSKIASMSFTAFGQLSENTDGVNLTDSIMTRASQMMKSGSEFFLSLRASLEGYDDRISRGNGLVYMETQVSGGLTYNTPRRGAFRKSFGVDFFQEGVEDWGYGLQANLTWYPHETLNFDFNVNPRWSPDWLIWLQDDQLASFSRDHIRGTVTGNWFPADRHEVRLKAQWLTIDAELEQGYRIGPAGRLVADDTPIDDFAMINFGLQLRYRYEVSPLSDFYIVYSRGGLDRIENPDQDTWGLLGDSTSLRDSDQILVKLRYGF
jgi:hypothetical protein